MSWGIARAMLFFLATGLVGTAAWAEDNEAGNRQKQIEARKKMRKVRDEARSEARELREAVREGSPQEREAAREKAMEIRKKAQGEIAGIREEAGLPTLEEVETAEQWRRFNRVEKRKHLKRMAKIQRMEELVAGQRREGAHRQSRANQSPREHPPREAFGAVGQQKS